MCNNIIDNYAFCVFIALYQTEIEELTKNKNCTNLFKRFASFCLLFVLQMRDGGHLANLLMPAVGSGERCLLYL
jgi:hypothetical protein